MPKGDQPSALAHFAPITLVVWTPECIALQQLAHMAILVGASHPELVSMAGCAKWGEQAGNAHTDVMAAFCANIQIAPPVSIQVEVMDPRLAFSLWKMLASLHML